MEKNKNLMCYTIGHSTHTLEKFVDLLNEHSINCIVDVRSTPYSERAPQFNRENLKKELKTKKIYYLHFGREFGARRPDKSLYDITDGILDFEKVMETEIFKSGIERIKVGLDKGIKIALMCSEKDPFKCHRFVLVSRGLELEGVSVSHILADKNEDDKNIIKNSELEEKLLEKKYLGRDYRQQGLFDKKKKLEKLKEEALIEGYRKRNKEIGYLDEEVD